jgi:hypothetical protein
MTKQNKGRQSFTVQSLTVKLQKITLLIIDSFFHVSTPFRKALVDVPIIQFQCAK